MLQSAPSSPSTFYHHASRRPSCSSHSPRFPPQLTPGTASRPKPTTAAPSSAQSPSQCLTHLPQTRKREYKNAATQYSPDGFPPTYRPRAEECAKPTTPLDTTASTERQAPGRGDPATSQEPQGPVQAPSRTDAPAAGSVGSTHPTRKPSSEGAEHHVPHGLKREDQKKETTAISGSATPSKRARPMEPNVKVMPLRYEACDVKELGVLVSDMLMELVRLNSGIPLRDGQLTRFHSRAPPGISVRDYLNRLIVHATLSPPILLSMVFYVDKLCTMYPAFTISDLTVHRFLITAATVAAKGLSDSFWTNSLYARVGGVSVRELALLELEFLRRLEWRIVPKPETLVDYYKGLVERGAGYVLEKEEEPPSATNGHPTGSHSPGTVNTDAER